MDGEIKVPLAISGTRAALDAQAIAMAKQLSSQYTTWKYAIERALFDHYLPYAEAIATGELPPDETCPTIAQQTEIWSYVNLVFAAVMPLDRQLTVEIGYATEWDIEHTLGARFLNGIFVELCGSVLPP